MSNHARLGPSNHRWPKCAGSVREEAQYEDIPGEAAIDGTGTHLLVELLIDSPGSTKVGDLIGANHEDHPSGWIVDQDRMDRAMMAIRYVERRKEELAEQYPGARINVLAESISNPGAHYGRDDWWGTCDITIEVWLGEDLVFVEACDYKDGRGWVSCDDNTQLTSYLRGKLRPSVQECRVTIVQPKTNPVIRYEKGLTVKQVHDRADDMALAAKATDDPDAKITPGKHCQWCKANPKRGGHCLGPSNLNVEKVRNTMDQLSVEGGTALIDLVQNAAMPLSEVPQDKLSAIADLKSVMAAIFTNVEEEIRSRIERGDKVDGYAMMPGKMSRKYSQPDEDIAKALKNRRMVKDKIFPSKLITVAALEKSGHLTPEQFAAFKKNFVAEVEGKLTLTKVKREDKTPMFADLAPMTFL